MRPNYTYCIYELRFSEDEAFRRVAAARLVRRFPVLLDAVASGQLHLTGLLMLGPHLTEQNVVQVMARAKHRTKREIARLVRVLDPLPPVPACIEPLGPVPASVVPPEPTWEQFVGAMNPVRELEVGERPREWGLEDDEPPSDAHPDDQQLETTGTDPTVWDGESHAPARVDAERCGNLPAPQRYKVQFTATEEYVQLVDEAKALLSHAAPRASLEEVQLRAMRAFVESLRRRKYGTSAPVRDATSPPDTATSLPRRRGRHIPADIRRAVAARDAHRCTYVDETGRRCLENGRLEFHHVVPFAVAPSHDVSNLTLRCASHNALAAEQDFGRELIDERRSAERHERFTEQSR